MKTRLQTIMLIDDSDDNNLLHQWVIEDCECADNIIVMGNGEQAIDYLLGCNDDTQKTPELIFLDINMPIMNGWEFLERFKNLNALQKKSIAIAMLTTSTNEDDISKAEQYSELIGFFNKPLNEETLLAILADHFPR